MSIDPGACDTADQNLKHMDDLDFKGWNPPDWEVFRHFHTDDVHVEFSGTPNTDGIDAHVEAMEQAIQQMGGTPMQVHSHPISFGSGDWTCVVGDLGGGKRMVTVARWKDGAISEEYIWM